ncbi:MAG: dynamin family protein [Hormoscilla sp. GUM202]|nr:dynamin family protein [Hormoscilla sp. GUM202]
MELEKLGQYKEYGESVLQGLEAVDNQQLPDWVPLDLRQSLESLRQAATKTVELASSPVKIGVMGEFSSGKTLLLGSSIGYADALPVGQTPTTGNVTAVHLRQADSLQTTKVDQFTIKYLSHSEVKECLKFMLEETAQRAKAAQLPQVQQETLKNLTPTQTVDSNAILKWCEQAWNAGQNSELRSLLRELVTFVRTYSAYGQDICDRVYQVDAATAKDGLKLADKPGGILELSFQQLPGAPPPWQNLAGPLAADLINSFSLIRRVDVTATISKEIWNMSLLKGTQGFVLLDFPGLGAADSGVRDKFLSLRELKEVQTILLLLNGNQPGGENGGKIRSMMEQDKGGVDLRDRILVGVGRFNHLPIDGTDEERIDELVESFVSESEILQELEILNLTMTGARNLTAKKEQIVLLSQMRALQELQSSHSTIQVCSPEFAPNLEKYPGKDDDERLREKWKQLSEKLLDSGPSILGRQLRDFSDDGGISRLRDLLIDHVQKNGVKQLYEDTRRQAEALRKELHKLKGILEIIPNYIPTTESAAFVTLRKTIGDMVTIYGEFKKNLEENPLQDRNGTEVSEAVKEEVNNQIFFWDKWNLLFNNTRKEGTIKITEKTAGRGYFDEDDEDDEIPTKSDDFYPRFASTVEALEKSARSQVEGAVTELLSKLSQNLEPQRQNLGEILTREKEQEIKEKLGKQEKRLFTRMRKSEDPTEWKETIIKESELSESSSTSIKAESIFPLARMDEKHPLGQVFDWSPQKKYPVPPKPFNHQILVLRLRDEINASAQLHLVQYVSELTKKVKNSFNGFLDVAIPSLQELAKKEALLKSIAAEESESESPSWLQSLSQTASISYPD